MAMAFLGAGKMKKNRKKIEDKTNTPANRYDFRLGDTKKKRAFSKTRKIKKRALRIKAFFSLSIRFMIENHKKNRIQRQKTISPATNHTSMGINYKTHIPKSMETGIIPNLTWKKPRSLFSIHPVMKARKSVKL
jgi:hypothetical protein